jgi:serine/threonine-protein kinase
MNIGAGDVLAGKYRVERVIGKGGMGMVVAAMHLQLDKRVALKFLLPEVASNPTLVARFGREARAASKIESEHVAKVLDVGALENGAPFIVMEYLEGGDLSQLVKSNGALPGQDAIDYVLQACEALAEAHVAGIVHRDLKPANLFLTRRADGSSCVKVLDFGISKVALAGGEQGMTQTSAMMGSPNYMSPEQLRSARDVDARADIWALGVIMTELLTGEVAFKADTVPELYVSILSSPPIPLRSRRPEAPPGMEAIILRCLEKEPARRFANVAELAVALAEFAPPQARLSIDRICRVLGTAAPAPRSGPSAAPPAGPGGVPTSPHGASMAGAMTGAGQPGPPPSIHVPGSQGHPPHPGLPPGGPSMAAYPPGPPGNFGRAPSYGPGYGPPFPPPAQGYAAQPQQQEGTSTATVVLIILVTLIVLGAGSCMVCVCVSASTQGDVKRRSEIVRPVDGEAMASAAPGDRGLPWRGPFQRPAGWTTVSGGGTIRPPLRSLPGSRRRRRDGARLPAWSGIFRPKSHGGRS